MIVVDANVLIPFFIEGEYTSHARNVFLQDADWIAPSLIKYEFHNVLATLVRNNVLFPDDAVAATDAAMEFLLDASYEPDLKELFSLTKLSGCTSYDCSYIALAKKRDLLLVTADKALLRAFPECTKALTAFI